MRCFMGFILRLSLNRRREALHTPGTRTFATMDLRMLRVSSENDVTWFVPEVGDIP